MSVIRIETIVDADVSWVYKVNSEARHLKRWHYATLGWYCPKAEVELAVGAKFSVMYCSDDGKNDFELGGMYTVIEENKVIEYEMGGRNVRTEFEVVGDNRTKVIVIFDAENENSMEMQKQGWSAILDHMKKYAEKMYHSKFRTIEKEILIDATKQRVWSVLTELDKYQKWSCVWDKTSTFKTNEMKIGNTIQFVGESELGLDSLIRVFRPYDAITYEVLTEISKDGKKVSSWTGIEETYYLEQVGDKTKLSVYTEMSNEPYDFMTKCWDEALVKIKEISEAK